MTGEAKSNPGLERLTVQERQCLRLVGRGLSSKEIAAVLGISKASVDTYCNRARLKLQVTNRRAAARILLQADAAAAADAPAAGPSAAAPPPGPLPAPHRSPWWPPLATLSPPARLAAAVVITALLAQAFGVLLAGALALARVGERTLVLLTHRLR